MEKIINYTVLIAAGAIVVGGGEYAEKAYNVNYWLVAVPLFAVVWPLLDLFYRRRRARASS